MVRSGVWSESGNSPPHLHPWGHMRGWQTTYLKTYAEEIWQNDNIVPEFFSLRTLFFFCNEIHHVDVEWIFRGISLADVWLLWIFLLTQDIIYFQLGLWDLCRWSYLTGSDVVRWRRANNKNTWVTLMDGIMRMRKMRMVISWEDKMIF